MYRCAPGSSYCGFRKELSQAPLTQSLDVSRLAMVARTRHEKILGKCAAGRVFCGSMSEVTRILEQIESGDPRAAEELLPLVYEELRKLAAAKLAMEKPGQTLLATALVHEAFVQLVDVDQA